MDCGFVMLLIENLIPPCTSAETTLVIVIMVVFDVVEGMQLIEADVLIKGEQDMEDWSIVEVFTAFVGQYLGIEILIVELDAIIKDGVIVTIIDDVADVVDGLAVIEHCNVPYIIRMPDEPKLVA